GHGRTAARHRRRRRLPCLPHAHGLHRALPEAHLAHGGDRRPETRGRESRAERRSLMQAALWLAQRVTAGILAVCVVVHLATIIYAVRGGLTAAEILGRTRGSGAWLAFYMVFVLAVAIHAPIGLRPVLGEWLRWRGASREIFLVLFALFLAVVG